VKSIYANQKPSSAETQEVDKKKAPTGRVEADVPRGREVPLATEKL
jgi:hypothetical protein